ncbi:MAG: DUF3820 family protein [Acidiferrobacterales bacterium]|nr:DUF3820 family protein [Acidiferrobacterales bacterium]
MTEKSTDDLSALGFSKEHLLKLARWRMPFGKYSGRVLIDLPEEYLFWFDKKGFPKGELGELLKFCLDLKIQGLDLIVKPLKNIDVNEEPGE